MSTTTNPHIDAIRALASMSGEPWPIQREAMASVRAALTAVATGQQLPEAALRAIDGASEGDGENTDLRGGVATIRLCGIITPEAGFLARLFGLGGGLMTFSEQLAQAVADPDISAIVLHVDSPGGQFSLVPEVAAEVRAARQSNGGPKRIVAVANTLAASAAYWIACQADEVICTPSGFVGSIGALSTHEDISGMEEQLGIKTSLIYAGEYKIEGNPFEPLSAAARAAIQSEVDVCYDKFVADVAAGRGASEADVRNGYGQGRVLSAERAVEAGLADGIETIDETVQRLVGAQSTIQPQGPTSRVMSPLAAQMLSARSRVF